MLSFQHVRRLQRSFISALLLMLLLYLWCVISFRFFSLSPFCSSSSFFYFIYFGLTFNDILVFFRQAVVASNGAVYYAAQPAPINNMPIDQFAAAAAAGVYPPGVPAIYPQTIPYQPFYQYYSVPMVSSWSSWFFFLVLIILSFELRAEDCKIQYKYNNTMFICSLQQNVPAIWPQSFQGNTSIFKKNSFFIPNYQSIML